MAQLPRRRARHLSGAPPSAAPRLARGGDLETVADLWLALTRHHAAVDPLYALRPRVRGEVRRLLEAELRHPDTAIFVVEAGRDLQGFATVRIARAPPIHPETCRAEITDLFVETPRRRRGVGRALVDAATRWARERGASRVEVRVSVRNPEGQAFWRALGYGDHVDVLERRL